MLDGRACSIRAEIVAAVPVVFRSDRPGTKTAAAIRADIVQEGFNAGTAKGAFERANHRLSGIRRQRHVAVLASRSQLEHGRVLLCRVPWLFSAHRNSMVRESSRFRDKHHPEAKDEVGDEWVDALGQTASGSAI